MTSKYHRIFSLGNPVQESNSNTNSTMNNSSSKDSLKPLNSTPGSVLNSLKSSTSKKVRPKTSSGWSMPVLWGKSLVAAPTISRNDTIKAKPVASTATVIEQTDQNKPPVDDLIENTEDAKHMKDKMQAELGRRRRSAFSTLQNILTHPSNTRGHSTNTTPQIIPTNIIVFDSISASIGLSAITSNVCGGPLVKIVKRSELSSTKKNLIEFHFLQNDQALMFYNYAKSGRFVINGQMYLPKSSSSANQTRDRKIVRSMVVDKARRCVVLTWNPHYQFVSQYQRQPLYAHEEKNEKRSTRPVLFYHEHPMIIHKGRNDRLSQQEGLPFVIRNNVNANNSIKQPQPSLPRQFSNLHKPPSRNPKSIENGNPLNVSLDITLDDIQQSFEKLGEIVSIMPMIKPTPTICIQYADVRSAIEAFNIFNKSDNPDPIWGKFFDKWSLHYGIDPCERTCPVSA